MSIMQRFRDWRDNTAWHHNWVANGPLWWLCRDCRALHGLGEGQPDGRDEDDQPSAV